MSRDTPDHRAEADASKGIKDTDKIGEANLAIIGANDVITAFIREAAKQHFEEKLAFELKKGIESFLERHSRSIRSLRSLSYSIFVKYIKKIGELPDELIAAAFEELNEFVAANPGSPVDEKLDEIVTNIYKQYSDPDYNINQYVPSVKWHDRIDKSISPADFIRDHYYPIIGNGLTRADILKIDKPLYMALAAWLRKPGHELDFDLPTKKQLTDRWVDRVQSEGANAKVESVQEAWRLAGARHRRGLKSSQK